MPSTGSGRLPIDAVILTHGVGGNFYSRPMLAKLSESLAASGCAALCVNNRGHDTIYNATVKGEIRPLGAAHEIVDDCRHDWDAWITLAASHGFSRIGIWGHSLGAVKAIYYLSVHPDSRVVCAVASSPPRQDYETYMAKQPEPYLADYEPAKKAMDEGDSERLVTTAYRRRTVFSAQTFVDKYGLGSRYDIFKHLPKASAPVLVTWGSTEPLPSNPGSVSFFQLPNEAKRLGAAHKHLSFAEIAGADHSYTGKTGELWAVARKWYEGLP